MFREEYETHGEEQLSAHAAFLIIPNSFRAALTHTDHHCSKTPRRVYFKAKGICVAIHRNNFSICTKHSMDATPQASLKLEKHHGGCGKQSAEGNVHKSNFSICAKHSRGATAEASFNLKGTTAGAESSHAHTHKDIDSPTLRRVCAVLSPVLSPVPPASTAVLRAGAPLQRGSYEYIRSCLDRGRSPAQPRGPWLGERGDPTLQRSFSVRKGFALFACHRGEQARVFGLS